MNPFLPLSLILPCTAATYYYTILLHPSSAHPSTLIYLLFSVPQHSSRNPGHPITDTNRSSLPHLLYPKKLCLSHDLLLYSSSPSPFSSVSNP
ncbi:hypothetical protein E2C01_078257 [Portunus trituberculatus]|uniref:Uncharacterized protein n=1 Tax=Portunus trituberculatus TaxID=210409 RepID=A0A5B7IMG5_PORTR|nr:hypothetical protein [Portunus trituberculatus]